MVYWLYMGVIEAFQFKLASAQAWLEINFEPEVLEQA